MDYSIRKRILENARRADFQDLIGYLNDPRVPKEEKIATLQNINETKKLDAAAGSFGKSRNESQLMYDYAYVPPLEVNTNAIPSKMPAVISSDMARKRHEDNLSALARFEQVLQGNYGSTQAIPQEKSQNMKGVL